jgi:hypothetical protein
MWWYDLKILTRVSISQADDKANVDRKRLRFSDNTIAIKSSKKTNYGSFRALLSKVFTPNARTKPLLHVPYLLMVVKLVRKHADAIEKLDNSPLKSIARTPTKKPFKSQH